MHRRKIVQTKKCETKISKYEKLGDEKVCDEKIFRRKTTDEKQQTKKCQTKKCQTKNGHGVGTYFNFFETDALCQTAFISLAYMYILE